MTNYVEIIENSVATYNKDVAGVLKHAEHIIGLDISKESLRVIFGEDHDAFYRATLGASTSKIQLSTLYVNRITESAWKEFFLNIKLFNTIGEAKYYKVVSQYELQFGSVFKETIDIAFNVENLTKFISKYITADVTSDSINSFLYTCQSSWKDKKTEIKTRMTVKEFTNDFGSVNGDRYHTVIEFLRYVLKECRSIEMNAIEIKDLINLKRGVECEVAIADGIVFKYKAGGNAEIKLPKDVVEFLNNKLANI